MGGAAEEVDVSVRMSAALSVTLITVL